MPLKKIQTPPTDGLRMSFNPKYPGLPEFAFGKNTQNSLDHTGSFQSSPGEKIHE